MIIQSDLRSMGFVETPSPMTFVSKETVSVPNGSYTEDSEFAKYELHNLPDESNWSNLITVKRFGQNQYKVLEYSIIHQAEYSSPVHLKKALQELGVIA